MATLQKIRSKGPLLVGVIALALFAFVAGDAFKVFQPKQPHEVGEVDGSSLSIQQYQKLVDEQANILKANYGLTSLPESEMNNIKDRVWTSFVSSILLENEIEKLGLAVTNSEVERILEMGTNPILSQFTMFFNQQGRFDKDLLFEFLAQYANMLKTPNVDPAYRANMEQVHAFWAIAEKNIVQNLLAEKYLNLVSAGLISNKVEAENNYKAETILTNIEAAVFPFANVTEQIEVTEQELLNEYNASKEKFVQKEESRQIKYINFEIKPSAADVEALEVELQGYATDLKDATQDYASIVGNSNSLVPFADTYFSLNSYPKDIAAYIKDNKLKVGEVFGPISNTQDNTLNVFKVIDEKVLNDSIEFNMVLLSNLAPDVLLTKTDSIVNALRQGGSFKAIAEKENQSTASQWISESQISNEQLLQLYSELNAMKPREVKSITTRYGNLILQVVGGKKSVEKYKLAIIKREIEVGDATSNLAYNNLSQFIANNPTIADIETNAEDAGYKVISEEITATVHGINDMQSTKDVLRWVFDAKVGDLSTIYECGDDSNNLLVVGLTDIIKKGYRPLNLVQNDIRAKVVNDKKAALIENLIATAKPSKIEDLKGIEYALIDTIPYVTFSQAATIAKVYGKENVVSGYAQVGDLKVLSSPIRGDYGVYVIDPLERKNSEKEYNEAEYMESAAKGYAYFTNYNVMNDLLEKANILDIRYKFF